MKNMDINEFDFYTPDGEYCIFGMQVTMKNGKPVINMFDLEENKDGAKVSENIWNLSAYILNLVFRDKYKRKDIDWTFTSGYRKTNIHFEEINDQPAKISLTDSTAFEWEQGNNSFPLKKYNQEYFQNYNGKPIHKDDLFPSHELVYPETPKEVFAIPCPQAKDGVFYCKPEYEDTDRNKCILVDTKKLIERIKQDDPKMIEHARYKFNGEKAEDWLEHNSSENACETGNYAVGHHITKRNNKSGLGLTLSAGFAGVLILAQELDLPFIPIQIDSYGDNGPNDPEKLKQIRQIQADIGYTPTPNGPKFKTSYRP